MLSKPHSDFLFCDSVLDTPLGLLELPLKHKGCTTSASAKVWNEYFSVASTSDGLSETILHGLQYAIGIFGSVQQLVSGPFAQDSVAIATMPSDAAMVSSNENTNSSAQNYASNQQAQQGREHRFQPARESFADLVFPGFDSKSFIWQMSLFQIGEFVFSLMLNQVNGMPTPCTLYSLGASWGPAIASGQIWRLVLPMTLHANMMHLFFNIFFQLRIGFGMEKQFGKSRFIMLYALCGVLGNLISVAVDPYKVAVGASTAGFGLIGVWLAEIALSWHVMGPARDRALVWVAFMVSSVAMMSTAGSNIDLFGHIGGAVAGFLVAILASKMTDEYKPEWYSHARALASVGLSGLVLVCALKIGLFVPRLGPLAAAQCPALSDLLQSLGNRLL